MTIWKKYGNEIAAYRSTKRLGRLAEIIWKLQPSSKEDWWLKYTSSLSGRSEIQLMMIADEMAAEIDEAPETCFQGLKDIICQTYDGYLAEKTILDRLAQKHKAVKADANLDAQGVDIVVDDNYYFQVKPSNFFIGNAKENKQLLNDRMKLLYQSNKFGDRFFVVVYKSREYDNYCPTAYRVSNLINTDGTSKNVEFKFIK